GGYEGVSGVSVGEGQGGHGPPDAPKTMDVLAGAGAGAGTEAESRLGARTGPGETVASVKAGGEEEGSDWGDFKDALISGEAGGEAQNWTVVETSPERESAGKESDGPRSAPGLGLDSPLGSCSEWGDLTDDNVNNPAARTEEAALTGIGESEKESQVSALMGGAPLTSPPKGQVNVRAATDPNPFAGMGVSPDPA
ncbi:unnamed protein product, partial [Discosporangium mesarthrocarpum]